MAKLCDFPFGGGYLENYIKPNLDLILLENSQVFLQCVPENSKAKRLLVKNYKIPLPDNSCDRFVSLAGIHHVDDKAVVFSEIHRCLKVGGKFALADVSEGSGTAGFLNEFVHENSDAGHEGIFLHNGTKKELERYGYKVRFMQPILIPRRFHLWRK